MKLSKLGPNFSKLQIGTVSIWFSYETPIAFSGDFGFTIRENEWGQTTGKHLNKISPDKTVRVSTEKFYELWVKHIESKLK